MIFRTEKRKIKYKKTRNDYFADLISQGRRMTLGLFYNFFLHLRYFVLGSGVFLCQKKEMRRKEKKKHDENASGLSINYVWIRVARAPF